MTHMTCGRVCRPARRGSLLAQESSEGQAWAAAETISTNLVSSLFLSYSGAAAAADAPMLRRRSGLREMRLTA